MFFGKHKYLISFQDKRSNSWGTLVVYWPWRMRVQNFWTYSSTINKGKNTPRKIRIFLYDLNIVSNSLYDQKYITHAFQNLNANVFNCPAFYFGFIVKYIFNWIVNEHFNNLLRYNIRYYIDLGTFYEPSLSNNCPQLLKCSLLLLLLLINARRSVNI